MNNLQISNGLLQIGSPGSNHHIDVHGSVLVDDQLHATAGSCLTIAADLEGSPISSGSSVITIDDSSQVNVDRAIRLGSDGPSCLKLNSGSSLTARCIEAGINHPTSVIIDGTGTSLDVGQAWQNGVGDSGTIQISGGANAIVEVLNCGSIKGSFGSAIVEGNTTFLSVDSLEVGGHGTGILDIFNSGQVNCNDCNITSSSGNGTVNVDGTGS